jgi:cytochrome d ubiquinol oxidase subunit II
MVGTAGASLFPRLVPNLNSVSQFAPVSLGDIYSQPHLVDSLTIMNASSSPLTLTVMFIVAAIGVPTMLLYTVYVYLKMAKGNPELTIAGSKKG